jgi:hypothetical protein
LAAFSRIKRRSFEADGERRVSATIDLWFRNGGHTRIGARMAVHAINRKFTPNRINRIFSDFSPTLPQCKHLHFIDG